MRRVAPATPTSSGSNGTPPALVDHNASLEAQSLIQARAIASHEADVSSLSGMVIERERTIRDLTERLEESNACHDRSIASLDAVSARLEELQAQARGQATRIRMKALREAVEVSKRVEDAERRRGRGRRRPTKRRRRARRRSGAAGRGRRPPRSRSARHRAPTARPTATATLRSSPDDLLEPGLYEGKVRLEIGPLGDFSQLVGFEEAVGSLGATDISVERFSEGRATFSMRLDRADRPAARAGGALRPSTSRSATPRPTT